MLKAHLSTMVNSALTVTKTITAVTTYSNKEMLLGFKGTERVCLLKYHMVYLPLGGKIDIILTLQLFQYAESKVSQIGCKHATLKIIYLKDHQVNSTVLKYVFPWLKYNIIKYNIVNVCKTTITLELINVGRTRLFICNLKHNIPELSRVFHVSE